MVITVTVVGVVQMAGDQVVDVVTVRHRCVSTSLRVHVPLLVARAAVRWSACGRVVGTDFQFALIDVSVVRVMKVSIVEVVHVVAVTDGGMPAVGTVDVIVAGMGVMAHGYFLFLVGDGATGASSACSSPARISSRT